MLDPLSRNYRGTPLPQSRDQYIPSLPPNVSRQIAINSFFTIIYAVGIYIGFSIYSGRTLIFPFAVSNTCGIFLFLYNYMFNPRVATRILLVIAFFVIFLIMSVTFSFTDSADLIDRIRSSMQLLLSVASASGFYLGLISIPPEALSRFTRRAVYWMIAFGILEVLIIPRPFILALYELAYLWKPTGIYLEAERDANMWGAIRPLIFASEPSFAGIMVGMLLFVSMVSTGDFQVKRLAKYMIIIIGAFFVIRSLTIFFFFALIPLWSPRSSQRITYIVLISFAILSSYIVINVILPDALVNVVDGFSFFARILAPWQAAFELLNDYPVLGAGIGGEATAEPYVLRIWASSGLLIDNPWAAELGVSNLITSNLALPLIYFGIVGSIIFWCLFWVLLVAYDARNIILIFISVFVAWLTVGGLVDARSWSFVAVFAAVSTLSARQVELALIPQIKISTE